MHRFAYVRDYDLVIGEISMADIIDIYVSAGKSEEIISILFPFLKGFTKTQMVCKTAMHGGEENKNMILKSLDDRRDRRNSY